MLSTQTTRDGYLKPHRRVPSNHATWLRHLKPGQEGKGRRSFDVIEGPYSVRHSDTTRARDGGALCGRSHCARMSEFLAALAQPDEDGERRGRIGVDYGSIGLCHVAAGFTDSFIEIAKGFSLWDLYPGQYILEATSGSVMALDGSLLSIELTMRGLEDVKAVMTGRKKFIVGEPSLGRKIAGLLKHADL